MSKIPCRWVGPVFDTSGYASATRNYIRALINSGSVELSVTGVSFEKQKTTHGEFNALVKPFMDRNVGHKIQITHLTPENFPNVRDSNCYNIAYTVWETSQLPPGWPDLCNSMDEIWVPSKWNQGVFKASGVTKPVYVIPHGFSMPDLNHKQHLSMGVSADTFVFYSIFQWLERKNPLGLLRAYLTEFSPLEDVCLALKTYRLDTGAKEQNIIKEDITNCKLGLNLKEFPMVRLFGTLLSHELMLGFHDRGDCFVLPHRGEGFGIPFAEAMSHGKPVIATRYSGNTEFMNDDNSYLIDYQETPVTNMIFPNYHGHMVWADPDLIHMRKLMREVFENQDAAKAKGKMGKKYIQKHLNWTTIGTLMVKRLKEIMKEL